MVKRIMFLCAVFVIVGISTPVQSADVWEPKIDQASAVQNWGYANGFALDSSGNPHMVYEDSNGTIIVARYVNGTWSHFPALSAGDYAASFALALDSADAVYVAYLTNTDGGSFFDPSDVYVMKYDGTGWDSVGGVTSTGPTSFSASDGQIISLAINSNDEPYIAFGDENQDGRLTVAAFEDESWNIKGVAGFSGSSISWPSIAFDSAGIPYVAYMDEGADGRVTVENLVDNAWQVVGSRGFSEEETNFVSPIVFDSSDNLYVQYSTLDVGLNDDYEFEGDASIKIAKYDGISFSDYATFDSTYDDGFDALKLYGTFAMANDGTMYLAYYSGDGATVLMKEGTAWTTLGAEQGVENFAGVTPIAVSPSGEPIVATVQISDESFDYHIAVQKLSTNALCRFYSDAYKGHFYTASTSECQLVKSDQNWNYEGVAYRSASSVEANATPVYRFWSESYKHHFYTASQTERDAVIANDPNWSYEGVGYYAYTSNETGAKPVYRFWSEAFKAHFYTISETEKDNLIANDPNWSYEGTVWHAK